MSTEVAPRRGRPPRDASFKPEAKIVNDERVLHMSRGEPQDDYPRLELYTSLGYQITEESWRYKLVGSQAEYEKRQAGYQAKGLARSGSKGVAAQNAADMGLPSSETISQVQRVTMTADDILADDETVDYPM